MFDTIRTIRNRGIWENRVGMAKHNFEKKDWLAAVLVTLFILILGASNLTRGIPDWGDDFAAYISEGIAIADGDFREQTVKNYTMHPSPLTIEASEEGLVYVWGYPLMLSVIYKVAGFDRKAFCTIIWYKLPLLFSLSLLGGVLVLFYRRRFSLKTSVVLAMLMCMSGDFFNALNNLYSDIPFLFFSMLTLLLAECFAERTGKGNGIVFSVCYGAALWMTHEIRLNGMTVCAVAILGHIFFLIKNRKEFQKKKIWRDLIPYLVFAGMIFTTEHFWLAPATSNMSDVGRASSSQIFVNVISYRNMLFDYLDALPGMHLFCLGYIMAAAIVIGVIVSGLKENLHLTLLLVGTLVVDVMLPYQQGLRYIYNILPLLLMFAAYGIRLIWKKLRKVTNLTEQRTERNLHLIGMILCVYILILPVVNHVRTGINNLGHWGEMEEQDVYHEQAVDVYNYIRMNVPGDAVIAFGKPRALYLNTERMAIRPGQNGHRISEADYYLEYLIPHGEFELEKEEAAKTSKEEVYENRFFRLYRVNVE